MIMNVSVSFIPFLIIILFEMLMSWMDSEMFSDPTGKFKLFVDLVQKEIILFGDHTMTVTAVTSEYLETSSNAARIESTEKSELWPIKNSVMRSYFSDLFFITLDTPEGTNVVSINEAVGIVLLGFSCIAVKQ